MTSIFLQTYCCFGAYFHDVYRAWYAVYALDIHLYINSCFITIIIIIITLALNVPLPTTDCECKCYNYNYIVVFVVESMCSVCLSLCTQRSEYNLQVLNT